ncbi:hypothetical protein [uncultured Sphingomonas sp.]|nr:hypothetical protein [uncultured Sphingomonas sp.]
MSQLAIPLSNAAMTMIVTTANSSSIALGLRIGKHFQKMLVKDS